jgi:nitrogenase molybdenum-cofactor synthesis protein NifE
MGIRTVNEISRCEDFDSYLGMAAANFNIVLNHEARTAAEDIAGRLSIPYLELTRLYQIDKIASQYRAFAGSIGAEIDDAPFRQSAEEAVRRFASEHPGCSIAVGEMMNANAFELALALSKYGFRVPEIYSNISPEDYVYIRRLAEISPETKVYTNLSPTMMYYDCSSADVSLTIGKDAEYYHPDCPNVPWNEEKQPFGYAGVTALFTQMREALDPSEGKGGIR